MSRGALTGALVGPIWWCADTEGIKYEVGEYSEFMSANDVKPAP